MSEQAIEILRDFGLPTFLLLVFVGLGVWGLLKLFPLAQELVATHVQLVKSLEVEFRLFREGQEEFRDYLRSRDVRQNEDSRLVREALEDVRTWLRKASDESNPTAGTGSEGR